MNLGSVSEILSPFSFACHVTRCNKPPACAPGGVVDRSSRHLPIRPQATVRAPVAFSSRVAARSFVVSRRGKRVSALVGTAETVQGDANDIVSAGGSHNTIALIRGSVVGVRS